MAAITQSRSQICRWKARHRMFEIRSMDISMHAFKTYEALHYHTYIYLLVCHMLNEIQ